MITVYVCYCSCFCFLITTLRRLYEVTRPTTRYDRLRLYETHDVMALLLLFYQLTASLFPSLTGRLISSTGTSGLAVVSGGWRTAMGMKVGLREMRALAMKGLYGRWESWWWRCRKDTQSKDWALRDLKGTVLWSPFAIHLVIIVSFVLTYINWGDDIMASQVKEEWEGNFEDVQGR